MQPERPSLAAVQAALLSRITGLSLGGPANDAVSSVRGDARASAAERLAVYEFMYRSRLVEALESQFPRLAAGLGGGAFAALAAAYAADRPSRHPSLRELGRGLPAWLAAKRAERPSLAALAALEWARTDVFDLADEEVATLESLRAFPPERFAALPLALIGAHRFVEVGPETEALWDALGASGSTNAPAALDAPFADGPGAMLLVWRQGLTVYHRAVAPDEHQALALVASGTEFGVVCDRLAAEEVEAGEERAAAVAARAFAWLSTWIADGLIAA